MSFGFMLLLMALGYACAWFPAGLKGTCAFAALFIALVVARAEIWR